MIKKILVSTLLILSVVLTIVMIAGSYATYADTITVAEMQNIYTGRILKYGAGIALLQIAAIVIYLRGPRKQVPPPSFP